MSSLALVALAACREEAVRECIRLLEAGEHREAAVRCEQVFERNGDPGAGAAAARALHALGRDDQALAWVGRLRGSDEEAGLWGLAADIHRRRGEVELAREAYRRQLELHRAAGDHRQAARSHYRLFYLFWESSELRPALEQARLASEEALRAGDREMQANAFEALFILLYEIGDLEGARQALQRAAALGGPEDEARPARLAVDEGLIHLGDRRPALAHHAFERALRLAGGGEGRRFFRSTHLNLVDANLTLGRLDVAERHLEEAWAHAEPDGSNQTALLFYRAEVESARGAHAKAGEALGTALSQDPVAEWAWQLEYRSGLAAEAGGHPGAAETAYLRAAGSIEQMRRSLGFDELKSWLLDKKRRPYEALFRLQARSGRAAAALETAERAKARTFLDAFVLGTAVAAGPSRDAWTTPATERMDALQALLPAMNESPVVALRPIDELLSAVGSRHILMYFDAGEELWLIAVSGRRIQTRPLAATPAAARRLVERFLADPDDAGTAAELGDLLLPPGSLPPPGALIYVVPDGIVGRVPMSSLRLRGRYLVEDHAIAYAPSINALVAIDERSGGEGGPPVVIGDPRGDLPAAAGEAREVADLLGVAPRTAAAATAEELRRATRARVLHVATHTGLGPRGPWLALADGEVDAGAVVSGKLGPRLVVLATCASAARRGNGLWGSLGAAFLAAGSDAVLASLWSIEDRRARRFVLRFYREGGAADAAGALARSQRALIAAGEKPSHWAPFVLFGVDRSIPVTGRSRSAGR